MPGLADAAIVGGSGDWQRHLTYALPIIPKRSTVSRVYALSALILNNGALFFCDTHVTVDPTAEEVAEMTLLAAEGGEKLRHHPQGGAAVALLVRGRQLGPPRARCGARLA